MSKWVEVTFDFGTIQGWLDHARSTEKVIVLQVPGYTGAGAPFQNYWRRDVLEIRPISRMDISPSAIQGSNQMVRMKDCISWGQT